MNLNPIEGSSNIEAAGYDADAKVMRVQFKGGKKYDYHGITPEMNQAFLDAPSKGHYVSIIKQGAPAELVKEELPSELPPPPNE